MADAMRGDPAGAGDGPAASPAVTSARRLSAAIDADELGDEVVGAAPRGCAPACRTAPAARRFRMAMPVAHPDRLVDVVGDEDDGLAQPPQDAEELVLQPRAHDRVDRAERLVHQQHRRVGGQRAGDADALPLAAGELARVAVAGTRAGRGRRASAARRRAPRSAALSQPSRRGTVATFSATVRCGNSPTCWMT